MCRFCLIRDLFEVLGSFFFLFGLSKILDKIVFSACNGKGCARLYVEYTVLELFDCLNPVRAKIVG
jgi:hypothetical protein